MKKSIRQNVFETNSSSQHSLTILSKENYTKWKESGLYLNKHTNELLTINDVIAQCKELREGVEQDPNYIANNPDEVAEIFRDYGIYTYSEYWEYASNWEDSFEKSHKTENGEEIVVFGYYGNDNW